MASSSLPFVIKHGEKIYEPSEYMAERYEKIPTISPEPLASMMGGMVASRQVAVNISGKWFPARTYQNAAVLNLIENNDKSRVYKVPNTLKGGGYFRVYIDKSNSNSSKIFFQRDDGIEYECKIHHGYDSEDIIGVYQDKFETK